MAKKSKSEGKTTKATKAKKAAKSAEALNKPDAELKRALRRFVRTRGADYLKDPNVTSIGVGRKNNEPDGAISIVFTVGEKAPVSQLEAMGSEPLPETIEIDGVEIPTDVEQRRYEASYDVIEPETITSRKSRLDPVKPGISVGHYAEGAGTLGAIVFDEDNGQPCILSNWHVLHTNVGDIGDPIVQPGPTDRNDIEENLCGDLTRSYVGAAGDGAIARLLGRTYDRTIEGLDVAPGRIADVELDDTVIKSGRSTNVTYGVVRRTDVVVKINYSWPTGVVEVGGFEIVPAPEEEFEPVAGEISRKGDSGSLWMIRDGGDATDIVAGLHFAGEGPDNPDEHAIACYPLSIMKKLRFTFEPPAGPAPQPEDASGEGEAVRAGFDPRFLSIDAPMPQMSLSIKRDAVNFGRAQVIPYTHFSVCLSARQRLARFVAWNVDGAQKVVLGDHSYRTDDRVPVEHQIDNSLYADNKLDRGHMARRADLAWGPLPEARQANRDSFFYTNVAPQHERYNRSNRAGIWGKLENLVLKQADAQDIRISVIAGPIFNSDDPVYRGIAIPREYWKLIAYRNADDTLAASCFVLSQNDLLSDIETLDFDPFRLFQISAEELSRRTKLGFDDYYEADVLRAPDRASCEARGRVSEALSTSAEGADVIEVFGEDDLLF
ncbi:MAG: DNA/RNA non-specific endonuclease [Pseudomonadota bacterium]